MNIYKYLMKLFFFIKFFLLFIFININYLLADEIKKINIVGNDRISEETIKIFSEVKIGDNISNQILNKILKNLYDTNFFTDVSVNLQDEILFINVVEAPIIDKVVISGLKAEKIKKELNKIIKLKSRSSYNDFLASKDRDLIKEYLKQIGYYFATVKTIVQSLENNLTYIEHSIDLGDKAKIKKISFIGDKIFKDSKLRSLIVSEEYKFWKIISGKKYLNEQIINFDKKLLKNFYLSKGFYNVEINTSFAKLINNEEEFELIFNINAKEKVFFNDIILNIPKDFNQNNFANLNNLFNEIKGKPYSINTVDKILDEIDSITLREEYKSIQASVDESLIQNELNLVFNIVETEKFFVERINIFGNSITRESVIRNYLEIDEGDPYNQILQSKSVNNLKSLNFFKDVKSNVKDGESLKSKIIDIEVEEKPTGEISAGAGFGTSGGTFQFGVKENNYLGKGIAVNAFASISSETFKGTLNATNPNYKNSDKSLYFNLQAIELDRIKANGYKTNKTGFDIGTSFEYYDDFYFGISTRSFYETIKTDSTASTRMQSQEGNYWDTFMTLTLDYDKRNQKFKTDDGYRSTYNMDLPVLSDTYTLTNTYDFKKYTSLYENNLTSFGFFFESANSISNEDVKLSERLFLSSKKLRGFEKGKVGPKDGNDFIGGNFATAINFNTSLPFLFENSQNIDSTFFLDVANIWGVDYDSSIDENDDIRSSIGIGIDWFTPVGPLTFQFAETLSKADTDKEQSFSFNIGTTF